MKYFGVNHTREGISIHVAPQSYQPTTIFIESDWSAASYYYEMAAFADEADLELNGLMENSFQGDAVIAEFMKSFGVETEFGPYGSGEKIHLRKIDSHPPPLSNFHLQQFPDLAPALFVTSAGLSQKISFSGLEHLAYKESHREEALRNELAKCGITVVNKKWKYYSGRKFFCAPVHFATYHDSPDGDGAYSACNAV